MREIIFRGKTLKGEWLYGFYHNETSIESPSSDRKVTRHHIYTQDFDKFVIPETVGQFTGLIANGKKIFEGDIVLIKARGNVKNADIKVIVEDIFISDSIKRCLQNGFVIGNIHDNPELLEESNEKQKK